MEITKDNLLEGKRQLTITLEADGSLCQDEGLKPRLAVDHSLKPGVLPAGVNVPPQGWEETVTLPDELVALVARLDHSGVLAKAQEATVSTFNGQRVVPTPGRSAIPLPLKSV